MDLHHVLLQRMLGLAGEVTAGLCAMDAMPLGLVLRALISRGELVCDGAELASEVPHPFEPAILLHPDAVLGLHVQDHASLAPAHPLAVGDDAGEGRGLQPVRGLEVLEEHVLGRSCHWTVRTLQPLQDLPQASYFF